jgi:hypothetical protein
MIFRAFSLFLSRAIPMPAMFFGVFENAYLLAGTILTFS